MSDENSGINLPSKLEEDYFFNTLDENSFNEKKYFVLVIYDISENKRRNRIVKILNSYGFRVQKSAFEAILKPDKYQKLIMELKQIPDITDSVRIYKIQGRGSVIQFGEQYTIEKEETVII